MTGKLRARLCALGLALGVLLPTVPSPVLALEELKIFAPGASPALARAIENASLLVSAHQNEITDPVELLASARADYARLVGALYSEGHYGGTVNIRIDGREVADISPLSAPTRIDRIIVQVVPGPTYRFSRAEIAPLGWETVLPEGYRVGEPARSALIQQSVNAAVRRWRTLGHAKADLAGQEVTANHATESLSSEITLTPGPKLTFGELIVGGTTDVRERRIKQIAGLPTGEQFSPEELDRVGRRLRDTGAFRSAALIEAETPNPDGSLDITAEIVDQTPRRFGFGAEYATDDGLTVTAFWLHRNILDDVLRFQIDGEISGIGGTQGGFSGGGGGEDFSITTLLTRRATFGSRTDAFALLELESLDEPTFESNTAGFGFGLRRRQTEQLTLEWGFLFNYADESDATGDSEYYQLFLPLRVYLDKRNDPLDTTDGYYLFTEGAPFIGLDDTSDDGGRIELDARWYEDFGEESTLVLATRLQVGSILGASLTGLPNDYRFLSGGSGTVRGQEYESLGVPLPGGGESGGRSFLGLQTEARYAVTDAISAVGFFDWGQVGAESAPGGDGDSHSGAGVGVRYKTPIGPVRFDIAFPVDGPEDAPEFQIYIGIGQAF